MSPLPLFLLATALLAAFAAYWALTRLRATVRAGQPVSSRRRRAEEQIRWDRLHPPTAERRG